MRPTPSQHGTLSLLEAVSGRTIRDCERVRHSRRQSAASSALVSRSRAMPAPTGRTGRRSAFQAVPALFRARHNAFSPACAPSDLISRTHSRPPSAGCADQEVGVPWPLRQRTRTAIRKNKKQMAANSVRCPRDRGESVKGGLPPPFHNQTARIANPAGICDFRRAAPEGSLTGPWTTSSLGDETPYGTKGPVSGPLGRAEGVGFEPTVPLPVHQLSGLANSATLAPLRVPAERGMLPRYGSGGHEGCGSGNRNLAQANQGGDGRLSPRQTNARTLIGTAAKSRCGCLPVEASRRRRWR